MPAYYNDNDRDCCDVLRRHIAAGNIPPGDVDERDIREVDPEGLRGYGQVHLFAGIGGFPLGLRLGGMPDDFEILTGGFPCPPFSCAGKRRGKADDRYLWPPMLGIIAALRPHWVIAENVAGFITLGLDDALSDLESIGYTCWPFVIPACAVGAPHRRDRVWIVAHSPEFRRNGHSTVKRGAGEGETERRLPKPAGGSQIVVHANGTRQLQPQGGLGEQRGWFGNCGQNVGHPPIQGLPDWAGGEMGQLSPLTELERPSCKPDEDSSVEEWIEAGREYKQGYREVERDFRGMAHGVSGRVAKLRMLGNAVVPQVVAEIARAIMEVSL